MAQTQNILFTFENMDLVVGSLHRFIMAMFPSMRDRFHDREELIQDTLVVALEKQKLFKGENLLHWLGAIARFECFDFFAKQEHRQCFALTDFSSSQFFTDQNPLFYLIEPDPEESLDSTQLQTVMSKLPKQQSDVLRLSVVNEMTESQVAVRLGMSIGAVRCQLHRAKKGARRLYEDLKDPLTVNRVLSNDDIKKCLFILLPKEREAVIATRLKGKRIEDVSRVVGVSSAGVKKRLASAYVKIRAHLLNKTLNQNSSS